MKKTARLRLTYRMEDKSLQECCEDSRPAEDALAVMTAVVQDEAQPYLGIETTPSLQQLIGELENLVGLSNVKELVSEIRAFAQISHRRERFSLKNDCLVLHMIFKGNPGTGKTTVARIMGKMLAEMNVLPKGHLIEAERADLVGEFIGHTAQKTREMLKKALGGILFIDEAYSLARGGEKDFGKEAIDTMVKAMEDHKDELILILAGYEKEMEKFLRTNPGLRSRFPIHLDFPDYSCEELQQIAAMMVNERQYQFSAGALDYLQKNLQEKIDEKQPNFSNARLVRNIVERAIRKQALRLVDRRLYSRTELMLIQREDLMLKGNEQNFWTLPN